MNGKATSLPVWIPRCYRNDSARAGLVPVLFVYDVYEVVAFGEASGVF